MRSTLSQLNQMDQVAFTETLGWVYEHSPWVAERAWLHRPFASVEALRSAMARSVSEASHEEQLTLIRAHPDLATRLKVSSVSQQEQADSGLDRLTEEEYRHFTALNTAYRKKFAFPFIMAVRGQSRESILAALRERVGRAHEEERQEALRQIDQIARFRLDDAIAPSEAALSFSYGKGDVLLYRTYARPLAGVKPIPESAFTGRSNIVFGVNVETVAWGEAFLPAYTEGDNSPVVATDSMKNFIQRHAAAYEGATPEGFLHFVARRFLETYPQMTAIQLTSREIPFEAVSVPGPSGPVASHLLFRRSHNEHGLSTLKMERTAAGAAITDARSGLCGLQLVKVRGNSFAGFVRDEYTTLPETHDRALFIYLDIHWRYADPADMVGFDPARYVPAEQVRDLAQAVYHEVESNSIQQLLHQMGLRILERFPQLTEVEFNGQNRTWETVLEQSSEVKVYTEPRPPFGIQRLAVRRQPHPAGGGMDRIGPDHCDEKRGG